MSLTLEKRIPTIKWYQIYNNVFFTIYINNLSKENIQITNKTFNSMFDVLLLCALYMIPSN